MIKKFSSFCLIGIIIAILSAENVFAAAKTLHLPQGRLGPASRMERYRPLIRTNMTPAEMKRVSDIIKQQEEVKKQKVKEYNNQLARQQEQKKRQIKEAKKQKLKQIALENEKLKLAEKEKINKQKLATQEQLMKQKQQIAEQRKLAEQKKLEQKLAFQKQQEQQKSKAKVEKQSDKKINDKQTETEREFEKVANRRFERVKNMLTFKKNIDNSNRNNTDEVTENNTNETTEQHKNTDNKKAISQISTPTTVKTNQDPQTKAIVQEISGELANDRAAMLEELSTLWVSAVQQSDTVYFAIMKLSNPNGEEVNKKGVKKILEPILSAAPLVGQAFVNPAFTAGSLIGSNVMGSMLDDSAKRRLGRVNDADLVILARSIDELQENLLMNYMNYKNALKEYELSIKITAERKKVYDKLNKENSPNVVLANTFYTEALDNQYKARQDFLMKRVVLEQMVGSDALKKIEMKEVEKDEADKQPASKEQKQVKNE